MNRRSFLSTLALIPGLGWVKPAESKSCERAEAIRLLLRGGVDPGGILFGARDEPCGCADCFAAEQECHEEAIRLGIRRGVLTPREVRAREGDHAGL